MPNPGPPPVEMQLLEDLRAAFASLSGERSRLRRGLHDRIGQLVTVLLFNLGWLDRFRELYPDFDGRITALREIATELKKETTGLVHSLNPSELDEWGLTALLALRIEPWSRSHSFRLHSTGSHGLPLSLSTDIALYRILREALLRSFADPAVQKIDMVLERRPDHILAIVETDSGEAAATDGILSLAAEAGAEADVQSNPGAGTMFTCRIPI